ncbi:DUF3726 domain-containing protein [Jannaschia sp. S6380]|uniref:DUF3726 domain-containing protein n=1 Tax=Jannaschia sp. S6380 TaxID=2926408 RepID=UPI001FF3E0DB|nr:DUF3726 domain-containing protein [Jannaschia sp. S6380]MCK0168295.1 DUF3726 domain-containing protein [Jannaschia sp. S6380]
MILLGDDPTRLAGRPVSTDQGKVRLSWSEVEAGTTRSARGAGMTWGDAEECGAAAVWLARCRLPWAEILLSRLEGPAGSVFEPAPGAWASDGPICGLRAGIALSDFAALPEGVGIAPLSLGSVLDPMLLLPFLGRVAERQETPIRVEIGGVRCATVSTQGLHLFEGPLGDGAQGPVTLRFDPAADAPDRPAAPAAHAGDIENALWNQLDLLAIRIAVPSSETSQARAGGAMPDDD